MKVYQTNEIKNIALLGSSGSGKTTLVEAMLFESGVIKRRGSVAAKNTVSDYFPVEQEYGYSVFSTVLHVEWNNKKLNIIEGSYSMHPYFKNPYQLRVFLNISPKDQMENIKKRNVINIALLAYSQSCRYGAS